MAQVQAVQRPGAGKSATLERALRSRSLRRRPRLLEAIVRLLLLLCGLVSILSTIGILVTLGENSLLFFSQRSWQQVKYDSVERAGVVNLGQDVSLAAAMDAQDRYVTLNLDERATLPFSAGQTIELGEEQMRVVTASRLGLEVERGANGTQALAHPVDTALFVHKERTALLNVEMTVDDTVIQLPPGAAAAFQVDDLIQADEEVMRVLLVEPVSDMLAVRRGEDGSNPARHSAGLPLFSPAAVTLGEFLTGTRWNPQLGHLGIWPLLNATLMTTFFALLTALPVGLGVAIYLSEFASTRVRSLVKPVLELLVGVPTVVFGYFALTWMTPLLQQIIGPEVKQFNTLSAGLVMGIMIVPTIASISEDALGAVPRALREASYALGATRQETIRRAVLPAAVSGIMAAFLLGISRAVGETMIVALAAGAGPNFTFNPLEGAETMTGHIVRISGGDISYNTIDYNSLFAIGLLLFLLTLAFNIVSGTITRRYREAT
ncbi:MAG: phosphate ABC transporter permease subunit PstC [Anaerolineaceae bacterium]|nr:phosphate ABC transporter permease subunit PstC [Anaerolineaceae bacterium]